MSPSETPQCLRNKRVGISEVLPSPSPPPQTLDVRSGVNHGIFEPSHLSPEQIRLTDVFLLISLIFAQRQPVKTASPLERELCDNTLWHHNKLINTDHISIKYFYWTWTMLRHDCNSLTLINSQLVCAILHLAFLSAHQSWSVSPLCLVGFERLQVRSSYRCSCNYFVNLRKSSACWCNGSLTWLWQRCTRRCYGCDRVQPEARRSGLSSLLSWRLASTLTRATSAKMKRNQTETFDSELFGLKFKYFSGFYAIF